jgi:hypothetical protein
MNTTSNDDTAHKVRENRLRRAAERQGLQLQKSRRRDPRAFDYGTYSLVAMRTDTLAAHDFSSGEAFGLDLDEIEERLNSPATGSR